MVRETQLLAVICISSTVSPGFSHRGKGLVKLHRKIIMCPKKGEQSRAKKVQYNKLWLLMLVLSKTFVNGLKIIHVYVNYWLHKAQRYYIPA